MLFLILISSFFGLILIFIIYIYFKIVYPQQKLYNIFRAQGISGRRFIPLIGQSLDLHHANKNDRGLEYIEELPQKYGYCFLFGFGPITQLILLEPELIADFLSRSKCNFYRKPPGLINIVKPLIGVHNLLVSEAEEHERARKMLNPAFHFVNLQSMVPIISNETIKAIDNLLNSFSSTEQIDLETKMSTLTLSIITSSSFGPSSENLSYNKEDICKTFNEVKDTITYRTLRMINQVKILAELPFWGKTIVDQGAKKVNDFVDQVIADRRSGKSTSLCAGQDILDLLLSAIDEHGESFSDQQVKEEALTFVLAGHETTANLMSWALYVLMTHDNILQACREEIDRVLPNETIPTFQHMADLQVIEAVIQETLRLYPPAPFFARQCIEEHTISTADGKMKIRIPVDATVGVFIHVLHRREDCWPRPLEFDYTRWIRNPLTGHKPKLAHPFAYVPFAAGTRNCIGQNFALLEAKIILALFVQRCSFELVPGQRIVRQTNGITMTAKYGILTRFAKRNN